MMWCPLGYIHLHEIEEAIESAARRLVPFEREKELIYLDDEKDELDYENSGETRRYVIAGLLMEEFLREYRHRACAASTSGQVVRLSSHIVRPVIFNHWMRYEKRYARRLALLYIDIATGKIDLGRVAGRSTSWMDDSEWGEGWQNDAISDFGELDGWMVCYPSNEVIITVEHLIEHWNRRAPPKEGGPQKIGRPRRQEDAAEAYNRIYRHDHGSTPWKEVLRKLE